MDAVRRRRQPVAARGGHVLDEGVDRQLLVSSASRRIRAAIRLDCAGLPPGELMASATAFGLPRRKAASTSGASRASVSAGAPNRLPLPMTPSSRRTVTRSRRRRSVRGFFMVPM